MIQYVPDLMLSKTPVGQPLTIGVCLCLGDLDILCHNWVVYCKVACTFEETDFRSSYKISEEKVFTKALKALLVGFAPNAP